MRFLAKYGEFAVQLRPMITEAYATGTMRVTQEPLYAIFKPVGVRPDEREMAIKAWSFNGSYQEQDEVTIVPPDYRIGLFDSEIAAVSNNWEDDVHDWVVEQLREYAERWPNTMICAETLVPAPWPRYDEFSGGPAALVRRCIEDGYDLEQVLVYERQNQRRPKVIDELEQALAAVDEPLGEEVVLG